MSVVGGVIIFSVYQGVVWGDGGWGGERVMERSPEKINNLLRKHRLFSSHEIGSLLASHSALCNIPRQHTHVWIENFLFRN